MGVSIEWVRGGEYASHDDDARAVAAANAVLATAGVSAWDAAEAWEYWDDHGIVGVYPAELEAKVTAWQSAVCAAKFAATQYWANPELGAVQLVAYRASSDALAAAGFVLGDDIVAGQGEDRSRGRIAWAIDDKLAMVAWEDGSRTPCPIADMSPA